MLTSVTATNVSPILDRKIEETSAGLSASFAKDLRSISEANATTIIEYIAAMKTEVNLSDNYRKDLIQLLGRFSKHCGNKTETFIGRKYCPTEKKGKVNL